MQKSCFSKHISFPERATTKAICILKTRTTDILLLETVTTQASRIQKRNPSFFHAWFLSEVKLQPTQSWITGGKFLRYVGRWHNCTKYCCSNCSNHTKLFSPLVQLSLVGLTGHAISDSIWANLHPRLHALWSHGCERESTYENECTSNRCSNTSLLNITSSRN